eukprot:953820-Pyramimonas_sp.AAC.1
MYLRRKLGLAAGKLLYKGCWGYRSSRSRRGRVSSPSPPAAGSGSSRAISKGFCTRTVGDTNK